ncbi:hypothetical protein ACOMHN_064387 [Nucella lapillus]
MVFDIEVISPDSPDNHTAPEDLTQALVAAAKPRGKTTTHRLSVKVSDVSIEIDGSWYPENNKFLTEESLGEVLRSGDKQQQVIQLTVTHCAHLSSMPLGLGKLVSLTILDLSFNGLQDLPWTIVYLKKLKILNLTGNQFYTVPPIVGRLTTLEELLLSNNCLEYLPTSLLQLDNLHALEVSGNEGLIAPPLSVCKRGLDAIFTQLRKRMGRRNLWSDSTQFYRPQSSESDLNRHHPEVKSLLEISVATVLQFDLDFFSLPFVPPRLKRHLYDRSRDKMVAVKIAKCSKCGAFFSTQAYFDGHDCRR